MPLNENKMPSRNFRDNLHYMDSFIPVDGNVRIFFKAIPNIEFLERDTDPSVEFVCALLVDGGQEIQPVNNDDAEELNDRVESYWLNTNWHVSAFPNMQSMSLQQVAVAVARHDWQQLI